MRYDMILIGTGLLCLLGGETLGIWMGANQNFTLAPAHAHLNLVGWVTLSLYGAAHRLYPALSTSRLAMPQMAVAIAAAVTVPFTVAYTIMGGSELPAIINSLFIVLGTVLFAVMFFGRAGKAA